MKKFYVCLFTILFAGGLFACGGMIDEYESDDLYNEETEAITLSTDDGDDNIWPDSPKKGSSVVKNDDGEGDGRLSTNNLDISLAQEMESLESSSGIVVAPDSEFWRYYIAELGVTDVPRSLPPAWLYINKDLNSGTGGRPLYLCYRWARAFGKTPIYVPVIRDFTVQDARSKRGAKRDKKRMKRRGMYRITTFGNANGDLNQGVGGLYLYAYSYRSVTPRRANDFAMVGIGVIISPTAKVTIPTGWMNQGRELNAGAGGDYVYLITKWKYYL